MPHSTVGRIFPSQENPTDFHKMPQKKSSNMSIRLAAIHAVIFLGVFVLYHPAIEYGFLSYDDPDYVTDHPLVKRGLTWQGTASAFTKVHAFNWHPLTTLSHMLDCELFGLEPWGHHLTNILLHTMTVSLLFTFLFKATGAFWKSAVVSALYGIHPLRVESVVWISERKDVLSGVFFLLTLLAYVCWVRQSPVSKGKFFNSISSYPWIAIVLFTFGLMSKPMLVTVPFVLLLLDYWPLQRIGKPAIPAIIRLLVEKIPFFILSILSCCLTLWAQTDALSGKETAPLSGRIANAIASLLHYLYQWFYPFNLAIFYPFQLNDIGAGKLVLLTILVTLLFIALVLLGLKHPAVWTGGCWFIGMLIPVLGLVQVGMQARADRYTYLPHMGLIIALVWLVADWANRWRIRAPILVALTMGLIGFFSWCSCQQIKIWKDDVTLWSHAVSSTRMNATAHFNLGVAFAQQNNMHKAVEHHIKALDIRPNFLKPRLNLGLLLIRCGQPGLAIPHFRRAVDSYPSATTHYYLGSALLEMNRLVDAAQAFEQTLQLNPEHAEAQMGLASCQIALGRIQEAIAYMHSRLSSGAGSVHLENLLAYVQATHPDVRFRNGSEAVKWAESACAKSSKSNPQFLATLACSYAEAERFPDALVTARLALGLVQPQTNLHKTLQYQISLFERNQPYRDASLKTSRP
jgi:protein O-mannosyl-transferase